MITETKTRRVEPDITVFEISGRLNLGNSLISVETAIKSIRGTARSMGIEVVG